MAFRLRSLLALCCGLSSCLEPPLRSTRPPDSAQTLILSYENEPTFDASSDAFDAFDAVAFGAPFGQLALTKTDNRRVVLLAFESTLEELGLEAGSIQPRSEGAHLPIPLLALEALDPGDWSEIDPDDSSAFRLVRILPMSGTECAEQSSCFSQRTDSACHRCPNPPPIVPPDCDVVEPARPRIPCPSGWHRDNSGEFEACAAHAVFEPCPSPFIRVPGDDRCFRVGRECLDRFPSGLGGSVAYVDASATMGDGSAERPFATLDEGLGSGASVIALATGRYSASVPIASRTLVGTCAEQVELSDATIDGLSQLESLTLRSSTVASSANVTLRGVVVGGSTVAEALSVFGALEVEGSESRGLVATHDGSETTIRRSAISGGLRSKGELLAEDSELTGFLDLRRRTVRLSRISCFHCQLKIRNARLEVEDSELDGLHALGSENPRGFVVSDSTVAIARSTLRDMIGEVERSSVQLQDTVQLESPWIGWYLRDTEFRVDRAAFVGGAGSYIDLARGSAMIHDLVVLGLKQPLWGAITLAEAPVVAARWRVSTTDPVSYGVDLVASEVELSDVVVSVTGSALTLNGSAGTISRARGEGGRHFLTVISSTVALSDLCLRGQLERSLHFVRSNIKLARAEVVDSADGILLRDEDSKLEGIDVRISGAHPAAECSIGELCEGAAVVARKAHLRLSRFELTGNVFGAIADRLAGPFGVRAELGIELESGHVSENGVGISIYDAEAEYDPRRLLENVLYEGNGVSLLWNR
ncbi:MAG: hypothetical protein HY791_33700 [Deltaproteobacteria bacterium]|nr:hypothetical protein [Deltaproteobacteria bacterium]